MECITKQKSISVVDEPELTKCRETYISEQLEKFDEEARKFRKHLAKEEALRQLQERKTNALVAAHRMSFFR